MENDRRMTTGQGGCTRCGGWVMTHIDFTREDEKGVSCLRCVACGHRRWFDFDMVSQEKRRSKTFRWRKTYVIDGTARR